MSAIIMRFFSALIFFNKRQDCSKTFNSLEFQTRHNREDSESIKKLSF
jgi:hypothetical protein